jgi:lysophospholipase L1-like esterase
MQDLYGIEPHVYAVSGYQWDRIYPMAQKMRTEMGDTPDAILILLGTNDYNAGVPLGEWFEEVEEDVNRRGVTIRQPRRRAIKNMGTFRGRINTVMEYLKRNFTDQQIVIMTPLHRGYANFGNSNVQPPESFPNVLGLYLEDYVNALREAADIWGVPLIDLYRDSGLHPADPAYAKYFRDGGENGNDNLHPNGLGHLRMARTIAARLLALPPDFKEGPKAKDL